jgi:PhnB protein
MSHVYVPDVDQSFELARAAGGKVVQEPLQKADPDRRCGIEDPSGTTWWLATTQGFNNA